MEYYYQVFRSIILNILNPLKWISIYFYFIYGYLFITNYGSTTVFLKSAVFYTITRIVQILHAN